MCNQTDPHAELLNAVIELRQNLEPFSRYSERLERLEGVVDALKVYVDAFNTKLDAHGEVVDAATKVHEAWENVNEVAVEWFDKLDSKVDDVGRKLDGVRNDIGEVRGGHARNAVVRNIALVADDLDCQLIDEVPRGVLVGIAKIASANGEPKSDVESFQNADLVLHVMDTQNQPQYVAVEVSFTVHVNDVKRAARNAVYLRKYAGLPSCAVAAGVEVMQDAQEIIDNGEAQLYRIERRQLQPE